MIKIAEAVKEILQEDEIALEALRIEILNLSAYAQSILPEVERRSLKPVMKGTIVVALSRIMKTLDSVSPLKTKVVIQDLSIKSPLCEITFPKTDSSIKKVSSIPRAWFKEDFFTITQGLSEITIICVDGMSKDIQNHFDDKPKGLYNNLVAVTIRFKEEDYIEESNMIYTLVSALASKRINLIEIVSTFTEISFIVRKKEMNTTMELLQRFFQQN